MRKRDAFGILAAAFVVCGGIALWPQGLKFFHRPAHDWSQPRVERDIESIRSDTLRVLVVDHPLTHEVWPRAETGLEFELMERFARAQKMVLKAVPVPHPDSLLPWLQTGRGDVIAAQLGPSPGWSTAVSFTHPYRKVSPVLAQLRSTFGAKVPEGEATIQPAQEAPVISEWSPLLDRSLKTPRFWAGLDDNVPRVTMRSVSGPDPLRALVDVAIGREHSVLITSAEAGWAADRFPQLTFDLVDGPLVPLAFAVRKNARHLRREMDAWLGAADEEEARTYLMSAYGSRIPQRGPLGMVRRASLNADSISPFDSLFQQHAGAITWEWELLAAMAFRESRFDTTAVSNMGARGLMQMMPKTAASMGLNESPGVRDHIGAASRYLAALDTIWMRSIPDASRRLPFVVAAYNAGPGHVMDAQRLADSLGLDRKRWEENVERTITLLALPSYFRSPPVVSGPCKGNQTFIYVRDVISLYQRYRTQSAAIYGEGTR